jgi:hypothetical protein
MNNSFYYFFSATSQVLGTVLALFGVFVIFRIQAIKDNMIGIGQSLLDRLERLNPKQAQSFKVPQGYTFGNFKRTIRNAVTRKDINNLKAKIELITNEQYKFYNRNITKLEKLLKSLIEKTIRWSVVTAVVIVFCLLIIPFGQYFLCHRWLLYTMFFIVIAGVVFIFMSLISILIDSLNDPKLE